MDAAFGAKAGPGSLRAGVMSLRSNEERKRGTGDFDENEDCSSARPLPRLEDDQHVMAGSRELIATLENLDHRSCPDPRTAGMNVPPLHDAISAGRHPRSDRTAGQLCLHAPRENLTDAAWVIALRRDAVAPVDRRSPQTPTAQPPVADISPLTHRASRDVRGRRHQATRCRRRPDAAPGDVRGRTVHRCEGSGRHNPSPAPNAGPATPASAAWSRPLPCPPITAPLGSARATGQENRTPPGARSGLTHRPDRAPNLPPAARRNHRDTQ
jgi:hypothetical protein